MNELITINRSTVDDQQVDTVNARELHAFLEVGKDFSTWVKVQIERGRFVKNRDFVVFTQKGGNLQGGRPTIEYHFTLDSGKHIAMMSGTDKGYQVRDYFLECEKVALQQRPALPDFTNPVIAARAWADEVEQKGAALKQIEADRPKVEFAEAVEASDQTVEFTIFAKAVSRSGGFIIGGNKLYELLRNKHILMDGYKAKNQPYQRYIDQGWFEVTERNYENTKSNGPRVYFITLITGKGQIAITRILREHFKVAA